MNKEENEKILDRLERIDHKEYSCGFEFADSSTFEEMCICFEERKKLANYIKELQDRINKAIEFIENKSSTDTYQHLKKLYDDIDKTEYIWEEYEFEDLLEILKGDSNGNY